jgi:hypothetical protein
MIWLLQQTLVIDGLLLGDAVTEEILFAFQFILTAKKKPPFYSYNYQMVDK